jgi:hypothetical protein
VGESRLDVLAFIERAGELRVEITLAVTQLRSGGRAFVLRLSVCGLNGGTRISELTRERAVRGSRIGEL